MLDLARLERLKLVRRPPWQRFFGQLLLAPNYRWLPGIELTLEDDDRLPDRLLGEGLTRESLSEFIARYNEVRGWTPEGWIPRVAVEQFGLHEILPDEVLTPEQGPH